MLLELRLFSLLDLLLDASQRLGCSLVGLGSVAQPGVDLVSVVQARSEAGTHRRARAGHGRGSSTAGVRAP